MVINIKKYVIDIFFLKWGEEKNLFVYYVLDGL